MKVLLDGRPLRHPMSGVAQYVRGLADGLVECRDVDLTVQTFDFRHTNLALHQQPLHPNVQEYRRTLLHRKAFNAISAYAPWVPAELLGVRGYALDHITYFERFPTTRMRKTARCVSIYDVAFLSRPELFTRANLAGSRRALTEQVVQSDAIVTISNYTRDCLLEHYGPDYGEKIFVTPLAITESMPVGAASGRQRPFFLYLGNIEPRKGVPTLIDAWLNSDLDQDFDLVLAGAPAYLSEKSLAAVSAASNRRVFYLGYVSAASKAALLHEAFAFVYPSEYEGFGIPVLEAMAAGTPVVTTDGTALRELATGAASLVPVGDPVALCDAMTRMRSDDALRQRNITAGLNRAAGYSWAKTASATLPAYNFALGDTG